MKNPKSALLISACLLCLAVQNGTAQTQPYKIRFVFYLGASIEAYKLADTGGRIDDSAIGSVAGGLEFDVEYTDIFSVGGGLLYKPYATGVSFLNQQFPASIGTDELATLQLPLYLSARTYFQRMDAIAYILGGTAFAMNLTYNTGPSFETGDYNANGVAIHESTAINARLKKTFLLGFIGAGWDGRIFSKKQYPESKDLRLAFSVRRYVGFSDIMKVTTDYTVNSTDTFSAEQTYKGGHWMFSMHLVYAFEY